LARRHELCAQWSAADAATDAAFWAMWSVIVGGLTMVAAVAAAFYARRAALETHRGATSAEAAVAAAKAATVAQLRPWIMIEAGPGNPFAFINDKAHATIEVTMKNMGKMAAQNVLCWAEMYVGGSVAERDEVVHRLRERIAAYRGSAVHHRRAIMPGGSARIAPDVNCEAHDREIYRVIVYLEYEFEGGEHPRESWAMFDVLQSQPSGRNKIILRANGNVPAPDVAIVDSGIGGAT
jgi:hypothetical protein